MRFKQIKPIHMKKKYRQYSPTALFNAYEFVKEKQGSVRRASILFSVPQQTLRDRVLGEIHPDTVITGRDPLFTAEDEAKIVEHLKIMANYGYGYSRQEVADLASDFGIQLGKIDKGHNLSLHWFSGFSSRWPEIRVIKPRGLEQSRAKGSSAEIVYTYFDELEQIVDKYGLKDKPHLIYNVDEKGISQDHVPPYAVAGIDTHPPAVTSGKSLTTTIIGCGNVTGMALPPYFVVQGVRMMSDLLKGASTGADGTTSETGWSNGEIFLTYLEDHFLKYVPVKEGQYVLLLIDGHKSHVSVGLVEWAKMHNILFVLPAHTSHILQPLDVGCYKPLSSIYNSQCHKFLRTTSQPTITKYNECELACKAYLKALSVENMQSAFRKTGISPLDRTVIDRESLLPAKVFQPPALEEHEAEKETDMEEHTTRDAVGQQRENEELVNGMIEEPMPAQSTSFFENRIKTLKRVKQEGQKKKRVYNTMPLSKIVSLHCITEESIGIRMMEHEQNQKPKQSKKSSSVSSVSSKKSTKGKGKQVKKSSKRSKSVSIDSQSDSSPDYEIDPKDLCCVCGRFTPEEIRKCTSIIFPKWVQCDGMKSNGINPLLTLGSS